MHHLERKLGKRRGDGTLRKLTSSSELKDFASNDYLGLARSSYIQAEIEKRWQQVKKEGTQMFGSTGSRLLTGQTRYVEQLEAQIAGFHKTEAALLFNCGYMANLSLLSTLAEPEDLLLFDTCIHASMREGIRLSKATSFPFRHQDLEHLEHRLRHLPCSGNRWICLESVYSMDGSLAPLKEIYALSKKYEAHVIVDEAHAIGIFGLQGEGLASHYADIRIVTFGKALGCQGAAVLGSMILKEFLINFASSFIYTTALPLISLLAIQVAYEQLPFLEQERKKLQHLIQLFGNTSSPIQAIRTKEVKKSAAYLTAHGFDVRPIVSPTVRRGHEILRIILHSFNTPEELTQLKELLCTQKD